METVCGYWLRRSGYIVDNIMTREDYVNMNIFCSIPEECIDPQIGQFLKDILITAIGYKFKKSEEPQHYIKYKGTITEIVRSSFNTFLFQRVVGESEKRNNTPPAPRNVNDDGSIVVTQNAGDDNIFVVPQNAVQNNVLANKETVQEEELMEVPQVKANLEEEDPLADVDTKVIIEKEIKSNLETIKEEKDEDEIEIYEEPIYIKTDIADEPLDLSLKKKE
ncbi:uncharacterized protein LOC122506300 [Leptopilina heterotoma]|uniref:uncharacterized protein LOC122506300 n=1 Tax=Leptopilina heterotoma TaxID=63436 RepID=UPI001CA7BC2D|nr:uncharacterized protein LOC122506300 [Leptopilina heterotoma]XP_043474336.1 uncharacterized protein LOC122506300 [Leptopilina heterotoma]XP_043474337.1 uncharacterized protein LOC122506300 [Leptopilina heterotoma]